MRNWLLGGVAAAIIASGGLALTQSAASQPAPAGTPSEDQPPPPSTGPEEGGPGGRMHGHEMGMMHRGGWHERGPMMRRLRQFALIYPAQDRNLSAGDVQKIAEAFLLWNGNHTWKVVNVQDQGERIAFTFATQDGGAIASFTMDRHTGRVERTS